MGPDADVTAVNVDTVRTRALQRLRASSPEAASALDDAVVCERFARLALASDFAIETLCRQPALLARLAANPDAPAMDVPALIAGNRAEWEALLRRHRAAESTRLVWRDVLGLDDVEATLVAATRLAEDCLQAALVALEAEFAERHGVLRDDHGRPRRLVVFGLGKLGGGELNFSSDVDLVYGYDLDGVADPLASDGPRPLAAETYFARLGQQLARLLDEVTADGFCHRVDLRLRPYGSAGRVAWSFAAMEQYFQHEGRDWERYAWQKARPVAGDIDAGERFLIALRPFIYRRYLDFGALDGLRSMKAAIAAEVARKDMADDIKRGPGGIREIEFLVQALQLIRGGREPELRGRALLPSLQALVTARQVTPEAGVALAQAYRFLRRLENRLQMFADGQVHALPKDVATRGRIACALDYPDWAALQVELDRQRGIVGAEFGALLAPRQAAPVPDALALYWRALPADGDPTVLSESGFVEADEADGLLRDLARGPAVIALSDTARARLGRVLPRLLHGAAQARDPMQALRRLLTLLHNILRRSAYLALLDEQPAALKRLVEVVSQSALLAERLARYPLLLDELLDVRVSGPLPGRRELFDACADVPGGDDAEGVLQALNETRQTLGFRIAMAFRDGRQGAEASARELAWLADGVVARVFELAWHEVAAAHGEVPGARFTVLGYGSLGGEELGFGSDLDLVFLYDADPVAPSNGVRPLEASRWFARLAQKIVALLGAVTAAGRLYDVDVRLRPDGAQGLLVSSLASYSEYQRERAWTWEHQALVRARAVAGDDSLRDDFERIRSQTLARSRDASSLTIDVVDMRRKMRSQLDRSDAAMFDLKQGEGGLVDLEFLLQALVLREGAARPALLLPRHTPGLVDAASREGVLDASTAAALHAAHAHLLDLGLSCTLDRRARRAPYDEALDHARTAIREAARAQGLDFTGT